jgi:DNA-directed RNA polymerase subunit omega
LEENTLSIPLDTLIDKDVNVYELTCVAIREADRVASNKAEVEELDKNKEKIVSDVLARVLNDEVEYNLPEA